MAADRVTPLATALSLQRSTFRHLFAGLETDELNDVLVRATRACEVACGGRRLAPFTGLVETHRAIGVDPTQAAGGVDPGSVASVASASYARQVGGGGQVRAVWLDQTAPCYQDMWTYTVTSIELIRPDGSVGTVPPGNLLGGGPDPETGRLWFRVGTHLPVGSLVRVTYGGGYTTVPGGLSKACRYMAAADVIDEDDYPGSGSDLTSRNTTGVERGDGGFYARAVTALAPWMPS